MSNTSISTSGIYGTDGETPEYNPTADFRIWHINEIFLGVGISPGTNKHVPKINDLVVDFPPMVYKRVVAIDETTLAPDLAVVTTSDNGGEFTDDELIMGVGPGAPSETYRVYLDTSVNPHTLTVDNRCWSPGQLVTHARIFRGTDLSDAGDIISLIYDSQGNIVGDKIPLERVNVSDNESIKVIPPCQTMATIPDGEPVTVVLYTSTGHQASKRQLIVENSSWVLRANASTKYVTHISMECPFLSSTDPTLINLPVNVTLTSLNVVGVAHYSDGSSIKYPIDGTRFQLLGIDNYVATQVGQRVPLVLVLNLYDDEVSYDVSQADPGKMSRTFEIVTTTPDGAYNVKLYCVPTWQNVNSGYRLRWFMYNLDRQTVDEVTNYVTFTPDSADFNPTSYGISQNLIAAVNLQDVNPSFVAYRYIQSLIVTLRGPGTQRTTNWTIAYTSSQNPPYGVDTRANLKMINSNLYEIKVDSGVSTKEEWLNKLYWAGKPIYDPLKEGNAPIPNFFIIVAGNQEFEYDVDEWNVQQQIANGLAVNGTVVIKFIRRTQTTDLQLGLAALPIYELP